MPSAGSVAPASPDYESGRRGCRGKDPAPASRRARRTASPGSAAAASPSRRRHERHRRHLERNMHLAAQALRPVLELDVPAEVEPDPPLDEPGPKAAPARLLDRWPALLGPDQMQQELLLARCVLERPQHRNAAGLVRERAVFHRVGGKLMEGKPERDRGAGREMNVVQPGEAEASGLAVLGVGRDLDLEQRPQRGPGPGAFGQEIVRLRQGEQPRLEGAGEVGKTRRRAHRLGGKRLDRRERVLHAVVQLVDEELALLLRLLALGDVDQAADHPLEAPVGGALGDGAVPDPDPVTVAVTDRYSASYCEAWCSNSGWRASS